jgi:hypothetical protein
MDLSSLGGASFDKARSMFLEEGYLQFDGLLSADEVTSLSAVYDDILSGRYEAAKKHRYDLGSSVEQQRPDVENTTQVDVVNAEAPASARHTITGRSCFWYYRRSCGPALGTSAGHVAQRHRPRAAAGPSAASALHGARQATVRRRHIRV